MSFFCKIIEKLKNKETSRSIEDEMDRRKERALKYTTGELAGLSDTDLFWAALFRTERIVDGYDRMEDGVDALNPSQKIFYSVNRLEMEVVNGGLSQFFVNSSQMVAPLVSGYMAIIGSDDHKKLYDDFIRMNGIDLTDLSLFNTGDYDDFDEQCKAFPFDEYDEKYYELEPLETYLTRFVRAHVEDF